jgi:hypothetical protein
MRSATLFGLAVCVIVPMSIGCGSQQGIVRGQSPAPAGAEARRPGVTPAGGFHGDTSGGIEQVRFYSPLMKGPAEPVAITSSLSQKAGVSSCHGNDCHGDNCHNGACSKCGDCSGHCCCLGSGSGGDGSGDGHLGLGLGLNRQRYPGAWYPTHHHHFDYDPPRDLVYPAANVPPATIVYPYYTCKGPDDFFKAY